MKTKILSLFSVAVLLAGCVHLPALSESASFPGACSKNGATVAAVAPIASSASTQAIQRSVNWQAGLFVLAGLACLALSGLCAYGGQVVPAIKLGICGLLLPVFGIWFAYHWLLVVILCLLGGAAFFLATHFAVVKPFLKSLERHNQNLIAEIKAKI